MKDVNSDVEEIDLKDYDRSQLPDSPDCPILKKLFMQVPGLIVIPPNFFERMPMLQVLDLSNTNIVSLPTSISNLTSLREFFLRDCSNLNELPTHIGMLTKLKVFDINGTELMFIPKEIGKLAHLEVLRVSLSQYAKCYISIRNDAEETVVPRKMISELKKLHELCISVPPEAEWWNEEVKDIQNELCDLENLQTLRWYLPTNEVLQQFLLLERNQVPIFTSLSNLMLTVGQPARLISCLPRGLEMKFDEFKRCLKWIHAEEGMDYVSEILASVEALFLFRHWTLEKLSTSNLLKLKYCLLAECNEMETLVDASGPSEYVETRTRDGEKVGLELLRYLSIHHMNKLQSIWKGAIGKDSLSKLKILALHTCPQLTSIFSPRFAQNLLCLTELIVEDCPKVISLISSESHNVKYGPIFPSLERIFLLDLPELVNIFGGLYVLEELDTLLIYNCLKLRLSIMELPHIKKIEGENEWWNDLDCDKSPWENIFVPLKEGRDLIEQLYEATDSLNHFHNIRFEENDELKSSAEMSMEKGKETLFPTEAFHLTGYDETKSLNLTDIKDQLIKVDTSLEEGKGIISHLEGHDETKSLNLTDIKDQPIKVDTSLEEGKGITSPLEGYDETKSLNLTDIKDQLIKADTSLEEGKGIISQLEDTEDKESYDHGDQMITALTLVNKWKGMFISPQESEDDSSSYWSSEVPDTDTESDTFSTFTEEEDWLSLSIQGFDNQVRDLKEMVLNNMAVDDCSVIVVSAAAGSGKTGLVKLLCFDSEVKGKFGRNIYFAKISRTYDLKVIIKNLLETNLVSKLPDFTSDEMAIQAWGSFLGDNRSETLLVLDDVWSDSVIMNFKFKAPGYMILVTSRITFNQFIKFPLPVLNYEDATSSKRPGSSMAVKLDDALSGLSKVIVPATIKSLYFKSQLKEMRITIESMRPIFEDMEKLNKELLRHNEETEAFMNLLEHAEDLVRKCEAIKFNFWRKFRHASKLEEMNRLLRNFVEFKLQLELTRNVAEKLADVEGLKRGLEEGKSSGWLSGVPMEKRTAIGFDDQLRELKAMVLEDSPDGDCSVVVVSAAGGCGKTTLVTKLCYDPDIKGRFGNSIYYVTISVEYDIKVIIKSLLGMNQLTSFDSDEDAIQHWRRFLSQHKSEILLVLDDVWSDSIIMNLMFPSPRYKILVTSRKAFTQFNTYSMPALNDQAATSLFRSCAFSEYENAHSNISDDLVDQLIKCCKNHPLALIVIGGSLKGKPVASWIAILERLSKGNKSTSIQDSLEESLYLLDKEPEIKQCYLDLGLFPEDQKIAATALMDMWVHLYSHDEEGLATMVILEKLSSRNLAHWLPKRKHVPAIANYCEDEYVTQHDILRELAIHLSCKEAIEHRERLIINSDGQDLPQIVNARILSISTGGTAGDGFPLAWNEVLAPKVEVFVLNFMSNMHPLPHFMNNMESLKVLIITNYGDYLSEIQNFPAPQYLSGLTRIRLDHVSISSISTTILELENLQKLSLIMCKIGNSFNEGILNKLTSILEIDIESCDDLVTFPAMLCNLFVLKKLSITNCHELVSLSEEFGNLSNLEVLRLASCSKIPTLPKSMRNLKKLRILDISHCLSLHKLPLHIGQLSSLQTIDMTGCTGLYELPKSVKDFNKVKVVCDEETSYLWSDFKKVKVEVVEEDPLDTFSKIMPKNE